MKGKIRFGIIGTNKISDWFIAGARLDSRFVLSAVCSRTLDRACEFASKHSIPNVFDSLEEMAASSCIDAVYIATPNSLHASQSLLCMNHGKHVLCEKPLASNAREVGAMVSASRRNGVALMEAMKTTLTPNFRFIMANRERLGRIRRYFASYCQYSSRYDKLKEGVVLNAFNPELSNGAVMDIGIYTIYPMVALFGKPEEVVARGLRLSTGVDGQGTAMFRYDGMEGEVIYSKIADSYLPSEIQGECGTLLINNIHDMRNLSFVPRAVKTAEEWGCGEYIDEYYYEAAEFIDVIQSERIESGINSHANSLITMEVIDEIRRQTGVEFPSDAAGQVD